MAMPTTNTSPVPIEKLRFLNARRSTIGCSQVSTRQKKPMQEETQSSVIHTISSLENQSSPGPSSSTNSRLPRNSAIRISPLKSSRLATLASPLSTSRKRHTARVTKMPGITLTRNSQCQLKISVR